MFFKKSYLLIFVLPLLLISCLHTRTGAATVSVSANIKILQGNAIVKINGKINENIYFTPLFDNRIRDENYYDNPLISEGTITKNETEYLSAGEEYKFSVLPSEVVTMNITSLDGNDVKVIAYQNGQEREYKVKGTDKMGLFISFQNR